MVKKGTNSIIRILSKDLVNEYNDIIIQIEPIDYVFYEYLKQYNKTMFICEIKRS